LTQASLLHERVGSKDGAPTRATTQPANPAAGVLIVEDDASSREGLADALRAESYTVATARNGREAFAYLRSQGRPNLILLDLDMPEMDGWEFRDRQLRNPALASIPVVLMTEDGDR